MTAYHVYRTDDSEVLNGDTIVDTQHNTYTYLCCVHPQRIRVRGHKETLGHDAPASRFRLCIKEGHTS
jgi:hypothetical protein